MILFEDDHLVVVNKPSGLLSQPNKEGDDSILSEVAKLDIQLSGGEDPMRYGLVHRLDRDTSGVLILSKNQVSYQTLQDQFRERTVEKEYHFLATGFVKKMQFSVDLPLGRHPKKRQTRMVQEDGRDALTHFKLIKLYGKKYSLWKATPKTGRTHQIRVHASESGLSILGDPHYSKNNQYAGLQDQHPNRTMLHCYQLDFQHPIEKTTLSIKAEYPTDFQLLKSKIESL